MICPRCKVDMTIGKAIPFKERERTIAPVNLTLKADEVQLTDCWKCPKCGLSLTIEKGEIQ